MVLLKAIRPQPIIDTLAQDQACFFNAECAFSFRAHLTVPKNWCLLGYIHYTDRHSWCHGVTLATGTAFTVLPDGDSELLLSAGTSLTVILLPLEQLEMKLAEIYPRHAGDLSCLHTLFHLSDTPSAQRLKTIYQNIRRYLTRSELLGITNVPVTNKLDIDILLKGHLAASMAVTAEDLPGCSRGRRKHYLIVQRVEQFMRTNLRNDIYINEMCDAAKISERALRYAFEDLLGISPNRYLSMLRLCTACRSLASSDISRRSVKSVALSCGLWDLSRFADSYRRVFGELPHDTLMRTPMINSSPMSKS
ncbi:helix-turn-helix domain-containing protein [Rhodanobacter sp. C01]|uniref:helix-turn-helix domain-containing protein n=1 Tax=Rhodanobacter sp. C01 TaxID=1945856 RepID=UPI0020C48214|nr:helix-turn-helix domain-containing protein [Rhodanobacter sp. C01]